MMRVLAFHHTCHCSVSGAGCFNTLKLSECRYIQVGAKPQALSAFVSRTIWLGGLSATACSSFILYVGIHQVDTQPTFFAFLLILLLLLLHAFSVSQNAFPAGGALISVFSWDLSCWLRH